MARSEVYAQLCALVRAQVRQLGRKSRRSQFRRLVFETVLCLFGLKLCQVSFAGVEPLL